jgi:hypothetical protein
MDERWPSLPGQVAHGTYRRQVSPEQTIREALPELTDEQVERIATALYPRLVDAQVVADTYGVSRDWVYSNAARLGARKLGSGPKAHKRFVLAEVQAALDAMTEAPLPDHPTVTVAARQARKPRKAAPKAGFTPSGAPLLSYKAA